MFGVMHLICKFAILFCAAWMLIGCKAIVVDDLGHIVRIQGDNASGSIVMSDGRILSIDILNKPVAFDIERDKNITENTFNWNIFYEDTGLATGRGFDDRVRGSARRQVLREILNEVAIDLSLKNTLASQLDVRILESTFETSSNRLASAGTIFPKGNPGIFLGHALSRLQTGIDADPSPLVPDIVIQVNFSANYFLGVGEVPSNQIDFRTVIRHEIGHPLGFISLIGKDGNSRDSSNPRIYTTYDRMLRTADGRELVDKNANFIGSTSDLIGVNGNIRIVGSEVNRVTCDLGYEIFSPSSFQDGSSLSHFNQSNGNTSVMTPGILPGMKRPIFSRADNSVFSDIGFTTTANNSDGLIYCEPKRFQASGNVLAASKKYFVGKNKNLIILSTENTIHKLVIYTDANPANPFQFILPSGGYHGMTVGNLGIDKAPAIILSEVDRESLLILSDLTLPKGRRNLIKEDFGYFHRVEGPNSNSSHINDTIDPVVSVGILDKANGLDVLTASKALGLIPFLRDSKGRLDKWQKPQILHELKNIDYPVHDMTFFERNQKGTFEISHGLDKNILDFSEGQQRKVRTTVPNNGPGFEHWDRKGIIALAVEEPLTNGLRNDYLLKFRQQSSGNYIREHVWKNITSIGDVHIDTRDLVNRSYISADKENRILVLENDGKPPSVLSGGNQAGHHDGPLAMARYNRPTAMCQKKDKLYIIDAGNFVVRQIDLSTNEVITIAGRPGVSGNLDGPGKSALFNFVDSYFVNDSCTVIGETLYLLGNFTPGPGSRALEIKAIDLKSNYVTGYKTQFLGIPGYISDITHKGRSLYFLSGRQGLRNISVMKKVDGSGSSQFPSLVRLADIDGDGVDDAVTLPHYSRRLRSVYVNLNRGEGQMEQVGQILFDKDVYNIAFSRMNDDAYVDMIVMMQDQVRLYSGFGDGRFIEDLSWRTNIEGQYNFGRLTKSQPPQPKNLVISKSDGSILNFRTDPNTGWSLNPIPGSISGESKLPNNERVHWFDFVDNGFGPPELVGYKTNGTEVMLFEVREP